MRRAALPVGLLIGILLLAANMRTGIVVIGPLADGIGEQLRLSGAALGVLTALPVFCFGVLSVFAPRLGERFGLESALTCALWVLFAGLLLRSLGSYPLMVLGTAILGCAIAVMNVLTPGLVRRRFPERVAAVTALYSVTMAGGAAMAAGLAVPLRGHFDGDWRYPLAACAVLALVAALIWLPLLRYRDRGQALAGPKLSLWRRPQAWMLGLFFGTQSLLFYTFTAWLAKVFIDAGASDARAGELLTVFNLCGVPATFLGPILYARMGNKRLAMTLVHLPLLIGVPGLAFATLQAPMLWVVLVGIGQGFMISVGLTLIGVRGADARVSAGLSGLCQSLGYLLAACGPVLIGALHDALGQWRWPMTVLVGLLVVQFAAALYSADGEPIRA
ncbi:MFS transporter [Alcanivorax sp. N3-2A]|nr:MFS transporter [Alcanivorax sp. N3-2A]|tara:strand:- start:8968 stop:10134 length:1167 start_codon:yes stop_codon:yes gene_type:complete